MPTRLLREGILTSEAVDQLDAPAEVFYRRLMSKVDDHGLYDARPSILRAALFPLRLDRVREADIQRWIAACEKTGLIVLYEADGRQYLCMLKTGWEKRGKPKYPLPPENICKQLLTDANNCKQLQTDANIRTVFVVEGEYGTTGGRSPPLSSPGFDRFWLAWPSSERKQAKSKCLALWRKKKLEPRTDEIVAHVEALKSSDDWRRGYIPAPLVYLNQERFDGAQGIIAPLVDV